jgi:hypothetical protein
MKANSTDAEALRQLTNLVQSIRDPVRFRVFSLSILGLLILGTYWPLSTDLESVGGRYIYQFQKSELVRDLDLVRAASERLKPFLPPKDVDIPWWLSRLRNGAKAAGVVLGTLGYSADNRQVSGFPVMGANLGFSGDMNSCVKFLSWLESHKPVIRLDRLSLTVSKGDPNTLIVSTSAAMLLNPEAP